MKIIRVESCRGCPFKEYKKPEGFFTCGAVTFIYDIGDYLEYGDTPEWCPLEEV